MAGGEPTSLTSGALNTGGTGTTTASVTPKADGVQFVWIFAEHGSNPFTNTTTVSGNGRTWTKVENQITGNYIGTLFVGYGASPSSGTITITLSQTPSAGRYLVCEQRWVTPVTANPVVASTSTSGTGTSGTQSLSQCGGTMLAFWAHDFAEAVNPDATNATWTEWFDDRNLVANPLEAQHLLVGGDMTNTASWTNNVAYVGALVLLVSDTFSADLFDADPLLSVGHYGDMLPSADGETGDGVYGVWAIMGGPGS